ncbi:MAG: tRNA (adenosine(37)-N6)-threonylcarbamoyltransferase complex transferase subunit TsaD, partial [Nanoarchaeota archaeon]
MILGIESTAHTFGIGIVHKGKIICNVRDAYTTEKGGIIPMEAARHHAAASERVYLEALRVAGIDEKKFEAIAFSSGPGLAPCLKEGMLFAKKKAATLRVPLICVNHCVAHLEIGKITGARDPVLLYASGANTQIIAYASKKYRVFGETLDVGVGNFIDTFARHIGLGFPGGPKIQELAMNSHKKFIELPYSIKGMDVSFSGLLTNLQQKYDAGYDRNDLAYSLQETAFALLVE